MEQIREGKQVIHIPPKLLQLGGELLSSFLEAALSTFLPVSSAKLLQLSVSQTVGGLATCSVDCCTPQHYLDQVKLHFAKHYLLHSTLINSIRSHRR